MHHSLTQRRYFGHATSRERSRDRQLWSQSLDESLLAILADFLSNPIFRYLENLLRRFN